MRNPKTRGGHSLELGNTAIGKMAEEPAAPQHFGDGGDLLVSDRVHAQAPGRSRQRLRDYRLAAIERKLLSRRRDHFAITSSSTRYSLPFGVTPSRTPTAIHAPYFPIKSRCF